MTEAATCIVAVAAMDRYPTHRPATMAGRTKAFPAVATPFRPLPPVSRSTRDRGRGYQDNPQAEDQTSGNGGPKDVKTSKRLSRKFMQRDAAIR